MSFTDTHAGGVPGGFGAEFKQATQRLRGSLTELFASLDADPESPQEVSRRIGINRNVAWKLTRVIKSSDPHRTFHLLPGASGMKIVLEAFEKSGAPDAVVGAVREALGALRRDDRCSAARCSRNRSSMAGHRTWHRTRSRSIFARSAAPAHCVFDLMQGDVSSTVATQTAFHLPSADPIEERGSAPPVVSTPQVPEYLRMMRLTTARLGHDLERFRGYRLTVAYPALSTMAVMSYRHRPARTGPE